MKATLSKDGLMRFNIHIPRRIGIDDLVDGIGWKVTRNGFYPEGDYVIAVETAMKPFRSRKAILDAAIESIGESGSDVWTWAENGCGISVAEIIRGQARVLVDKKFPELKNP